jgi:hypothetical protein
MGEKKWWDRSQYPPNWEQISQEKRESSNHTCEFCGNVNGESGTNRNGGSYTVRVAAAHKWPNDTANPDPELYCLCQSCHRTYDNSFQDIIEEGKHQATMHEIALNQGGYTWCDHPDCQGMFLPHEH